MSPLQATYTVSRSSCTHVNDNLVPGLSSHVAEGLVLLSFRGLFSHIRIYHGDCRQSRRSVLLKMNWLHFRLFSLVALPLFVRTGLVPNSCETQISITEAVRVGEQIINVTAPACADYVPSNEPVHITQSILARRAPLGALERRHAQADKLLARQGSASECSGPTICECGTPCTVECGGFTSPDPNPSVSDCDTLITILRSFPDVIGSTFVQGTGFPNPILVGYSTCSVAFGNTRTDKQEVEYCWDGLALVASSMVTSCVAPGITPQGGQCNSDNTDWAASIGGVER